MPSISTLRIKNAFNEVFFLYTFSMKLMEWLYPKQCVGCGEWGRYGCDDCFSKLRLSEEYGESCLSLFEYQGLVKKMIQQLKFGYLRNLEKELTRLIDWGLEQQLKKSATWKFRDFVNERPVVQSISLYWRRENWRGFNQAEMVARSVGQKLDLEILDALVRRKSTQSQVGLSRAERRDNTKNAFGVKGVRLPKKILLVDDVWTTGATMRAAREVLKKNGAGQVWGLTLAR